MGGWVPHVSASSFLLLSSPSHPVSSLISVAAVWGVYVPQRALVPLHFSARPFHAMPGLQLLDYPILPCLAVAPVQKLAVRSRRFKRARPARALPKPSAGSRPFPWYRTRVLLVLVHSAQHVDVTLFTVKRWQNTVSHNIIYIP